MQKKRPLIVLSLLAVALSTVAIAVAQKTAAPKKVDGGDNDQPLSIGDNGTPPFLGDGKPGADYHYLYIGSSETPILEQREDEYYIMLKRDSRPACYVPAAGKTIKFDKMLKSWRLLLTGDASDGGSAVVVSYDAREPRKIRIHEMKPLKVDNDGLTFGFTPRIEMLTQDNSKNNELAVGASTAVDRFGTIHSCPDGKCAAKTCP